MLVGRQAELAIARDAIAQARTGRGQVLVISGEAGLGKSALAAAIAAAADGFDATWGRAWEDADAPAYFPLWPCLRSLAIAPTEHDPFALFERVLEQLVDAARVRPVLWLVEDLHVADMQTLDLLCLLATAIRAMPVAIVATTRDHDARLDERARQRIARLSREGRELRLAPLPAADCAALARAHGKLDDRELADLVARAGGNPLFVIECARAPGRVVPSNVATAVGERVAALSHDARALLGDAAVIGNELSAATLAAMTGKLPAQVIDGLAPAVKAGVLEELAPGAFRFSHALVREAIEAGMSEAARVDAHARAECALAKLPETTQIVVARAHHALASLSAPRDFDVAQLAARAAFLLTQSHTFDRAFALTRQVIELRATGVLPPARFDELYGAGITALGASHYRASREYALEAAALARTSGNANQLANAAMLFGEELRFGFVDRALVELLEEALAPSAVRVDDTIGHRGVVRPYVSAPRATTAKSDAGRASETETESEPASESETEPEPDTVSESDAGSDAASGSDAGSDTRSESEPASAAATASMLAPAPGAARSLEAVPAITRDATHTRDHERQLHPSLRCLLEARLAAALQPARDPQQPIAMARKAIASARAFETPANTMFAAVLSFAVSAMIEFVDVAEMRELHREHVAVDPHNLRAHTRLVLADVETGDYEAADADLERLIALANDAGMPRYTWRARMLASMRACSRGNFDESERLIAEVERLAQMIDDPQLAATLPPHRLMRALDMHDATQILPWIESGQFEQGIGAMPGAKMVAGIVRGMIYTRFGETARLTRTLVDGTYDAVMANGTTGWVALGEICAAAGTDEQRRILRDRLAPLTERGIVFGATPMAFSGPVRRSLGLLEAALGNRAAAREQFEAANARMREVGYRTWTARIAFELADVVDDPRAQLDETITIATEIGAHGLVARARAKLAALDARTSAAPTPAAQAPAAQASATPVALAIERDGDTWRVAWGERIVRVADSRGMELLASLAQRPNEELHVLALAGGEGGAMVESNAGPQLDARAARAYRERLATLDEAIAAAEVRSDIAAFQRLSTERDALLAELSRGFGLSGARKAGSATERARVNVQRRIKDAITRIAQLDDRLGDYLKVAIRTGTYCMFRP